VSFLAAGAFALASLATTRAASAAEADPRDAVLQVARSGVEHGISALVRGKLEKLHSEGAAYAHRDEVTLLLARCRFREGKYVAAADLLEQYEGDFPNSSRFFLPAAYWLARTELELAGDSASRERRTLLGLARGRFQRVLRDSVESRLLTGSRFFLGVTLFEEGDYKRALSTFQAAARLTSREAGALHARAEDLSLYIGRTHLALRDFAQAVGEFKAFVKKFRSSRSLPDAHYWLGEAYYYDDKWSDAADAYLDSRRAADRPRDPRRVRARYARGWALTKLGEKLARAGRADDARREWQQALPEFEALLGHEKETVRKAAVFESSKLLCRLGHHAKAVDRLLLRSDDLTDPGRHPGHAPAALYILGKSRAGSNKPGEAAEVLKRALEAGAGGELARRVRFALAEALVEQGKVEAALEELEPLTEAERSASVRAAARLKMAHIRRRAAEIARLRGDTGAAGVQLGRAYRILGELAGDPVALAELAADEVAYWRGRSAYDRALLASAGTSGTWSERALEAYAEVRKHAGWNEWALRSLLDEAELHESRGELRRAVRAYRDIISHAEIPADSKEKARVVEVRVRLALADAELERGRPAPAREVLKPILELAGAAYRRALALSREADSEKEGEKRRAALRLAVGELEKFIDEDHAESEFVPHAHEELGNCLARLDRHAEAAAHYETVLEDFPEYAERDRVEFAAGGARRLTGEVQTAVDHYRSLSGRWRSKVLGARASLEEARIELGKARLEKALQLARDALRIARTVSAGEDKALLGRAANEARELCGAILLRLQRHEEAVEAFREAARDEDPAFRAKAKFRRAGALLAWGRSGELARPEEKLRAAARAFTEVHYVSTSATLKDGAIFGAVEALLSLASAERAAADRGQGAKDLRDALRLLKLASEQEGPEVVARAKKIEAGLRKLENPR
jgi:tetratricopeptide (TPR) repeat protein